MAAPSYLELLAEQDAEARVGFDENARDLLVEQNEYEESVPADDQHPDELEHQEDFRKFGGSHQKAWTAPDAPKYSDLTKQSVLYDKQIKVHVINVDSRYRENPATPMTPAGTLSTNFLWKLPTTIKNVISVRVSSIELPNTSYDFSLLKKNTSFNITITGIGTKYFDLPPGNYSDASDLVNTMQDLVNNGAYLGEVTPEYAPQGGFGAGLFAITFDTITGKITIEYTGSPVKNFTLAFTDEFPDRAYDWGLGYNLGFTSRSPSTVQLRGYYTGNYKYTSATVVDLIGPNYYILKLDPDWMIVEHHGLVEKYLSIGIAKIVVNVPKNAIIYDNGANTVFKSYPFQQPTNITSFPVEVMDPYGEVVDMQGANFSFTLEITEALNPALYEHVRQH